MLDTPNLAASAALLGDRTRAAMISVLMDGRAHTATELAMAAGVAPSTASSHLGRLAAGGLVTIAREGRHRYYRLASREVADVVEGLTRLTPVRAARRPRTVASFEPVRRARVCYDHLAGVIGVRFMDRLEDAGYVEEKDGEVAVTPAGERWFEKAAGVDLGALRARRRPLVRSCLDWSERRNHLAGALGAAILDRLFAIRAARRVAGSRAVLLSPRGERFVERLEGLERQSGRTGRYGRERVP